MEKIIQVVIYDDEDTKLVELAKTTERSKSGMIRFLINEAHKLLKADQPQPIEVKEELQRR